MRRLPFVKCIMDIRDTSPALMRLLNQASAVIVGRCDQRFESSRAGTGHAACRPGDAKSLQDPGFHTLSHSPSAV